MINIAVTLRPQPSFRSRRIGRCRELGTFIHVLLRARRRQRTTEGFGVHWDDHDTLVVQLDGAKRWRSYGTTQPFPLYRDIEGPGEASTEPGADLDLHPRRRAARAARPVACGLRAPAPCTSPAACRPTPPPTCGHRDVLASERKERARIRSEKGTGRAHGARPGWVTLGGRRSPTVCRRCAVPHWGRAARRHRSG
ncbi:JmjC domain-containing protein [Streptomyces azureus]|uniref:JmjC domain-containing protein n=1 Tax=Streptomyces azureus TaxID=146537 RepID=UPI003C30814B